MEQQPSDRSFQSLLKTLSLIYFCLLSFQVLFVIAAFIQQRATYFEFENSQDIYIYAVPVLAVAALVGGMLMFREQLSTLAYKESMREKLSGYQNAYLIRITFLEAASLFGITAFILKGNLFSLLFSGLIILYFLTLRPAKSKVEADLELEN